ncbi:hypothetical protein NL50_17275 [Clostridium acetobutylicum]|nr:hypothetical protein NL50_17275 [Clostridium acetobutylicum]
MYETNVQETTKNGLEVLKTLKLNRFTYGDKSYQLGLLLETITNSDPDLWSSPAPDTRIPDTQTIVAYLIDSVQRLDKRLETIENRLNTSK